MNTIPEGFQMQLWDGARGEYVPTKLRCPWTRSRQWRLVRADRPLRPKYLRPRSNPFSRLAHVVCQEYLQWAERKGLTKVTAYRGHWVSFREVQYVDAEEYFSVRSLQ